MLKVPQVYDAVHCYAEQMYAAVHSDRILPVTAESEGVNSFAVVLVTASAGGIPALIGFLGGLPKYFSAPIVVAQHLPPLRKFESRLDRVLQRAISLDVKWAEDGELPLPGTIYLAPQDQMTCFDDRGLLSTSRIRHVPGRTPSADSLFRSAAACLGQKVLAVVLSGALADGADGCLHIAQAGGAVLVQSHATSQFSDMPRAAFEKSQIGLAFDPIALAHTTVALVMMPGTADWFRVSANRVFGARWNWNDL